MRRAYVDDLYLAIELSAGIKFNRKLEHVAVLDEQAAV
jgi:hypothetical protein